MIIYLYDDPINIQESCELIDLTTELKDLLDEMDLPRQTQDRLAALIRDRDRETGRLAYLYGLRAESRKARLMERDRAGPDKDDQKGAGG